MHRRLTKVVMASNFRQFSCDLVESYVFKTALLLVIAIDTISIGIKASQHVTVQSVWYISAVGEAFVAIYLTELVIQLNAWRVDFFKTWWNNFNLVVVTLDIVGLCILLTVQSIGIFNLHIFRLIQAMKIFVAIRALRVIRIIRVLKNLQIIVLTLWKSLPGIGAIVTMIALVLYIFAIIGRDLYGEADQIRFGNLGRASFTLFQLMTLDDWFYIYSNVSSDYQHILIFLILFIVIETLIFLNLLVAVIVDNLTRAQSFASINTSPAELEDTSLKSTEQESVYEETNSSHQFEDHQSDTIGRYLKTLNSLKHHLRVTQKHQRTLDKLVDVVDLSKS